MTATMFDRDGAELHTGDPVRFYSSTTKHVMKAYVTGRGPIGQMLEVKIVGDPYAVFCPLDQIQKGHQMATTTTERPSRKELRKLAMKLRIEGWESLDTDSLWKAVQKAQSNGSAPKPKATAQATTKPKKAKAKSAKTKKAVSKPAARTAKPKTSRASKATKKPARVEKAKSKLVGHPANPFRPGVALWHITEELLKGGKRMPMIARLLKKIDLHPWAKDKAALDETFEMDKRVLLAANSLKRKHGWTIVLTGRGPAEGTIKAIPPKAGSSPKTKKPATKAKTKKRVAAKRKIASKTKRKRAA